MTGAAEAADIAEWVVCGVGGFTIIEALDRGESSMNDWGDDAIVARADAERADIGLGSILGSDVGNGTGGKLDDMPSTYAG